MSNSYFKATLLSVIMSVTVLVVLACTPSISDTSPGDVSGFENAATTLSSETSRANDGQVVDLYEVSNSAVVEMAHSTVALIHSYDLVEQNDGSLKVDGTPLALEYNLCPTEQFTQQNSAAFCSGALIAPDLILTAGHCITSGYECSMTRFVFGFEINKPGQEPLSIASREVYNCAMIMHREQDDLGSDYALIKLDRPVNNHAPLTLRPSGSAQSGDDVFIIGHPSGLPTKVTSGLVTSTGQGFFVAQIEAHEGSSGSPLFSTKTGLIEGILVRGENDFVTENGCNITNSCTSESCRGEDVTDAKAITQFLNLSTVGEQANPINDSKNSVQQPPITIDPGAPPPPNYDYDDEDTLDA